MDKIISGQKITLKADVQDPYMLKGEFEVDWADEDAARADPDRRINLMAWSIVCLNR